MEIGQLLTRRYLVQSDVVNTHALIWKFETSGGLLCVSGGRKWDYSIEKSME